jgi:hypothetical protein
MAAASTKPIGYQVSVIILSLGIVILGTLVYLDQKNLRQLAAENLKSVSERQKVEAALKKRDEEYDDLKKLTGNPYDEYGLGEDGNTGKVRGANLADITKAGVVEMTHKAAINGLLQRATDLEKERERLRTELEGLQKTILDLQRQYQVQVDQNSAARSRAETDLAVVTKNKEEEIKAKQKMIDDLRQQVNEANKELENEKAAREKEVKQLNEDIAKYKLINDRLVAQIDEITKTSFEVPDGEIRWVDSQNGRVWINLGEADNLPKRMTFSVYTKAHNGVARGSNDIKGAIEVTRVIDAHTAEARITKDDLYQPIAKGDPIFTPIWSPGRKENFSFVGIIDLDGDGVSDRLKLHELVSGAGAAIDNEVDDDGHRIRYVKFPTESVAFGEGVPGIDVNTKFLVIGRIPDLTLAATDADKERIQRILNHLKALQQEARQQGVRIVNLNDFLSWIGYTPQRRLFVPGAENGYTLKAGQREAPVDKMSGQVSGAISGNKRIKAPTSSGQVSGVAK